MTRSAARVVRIGIRGMAASALLLAAVHLAAAVLPGNILFGSYGALAVVLIALEKEPVARPVAVIVAHMIAAVIGYSLFTLSPFLPQVLVIPLGIGLVLAAMAQTNTIHPPAGGLVFVALAPGSPVGELGLWFLPLCGFAGPLVFLAINRLVAWLTRGLESPGHGEATSLAKDDRPRNAAAPLRQGASTQSWVDLS